MLKLRNARIYAALLWVVMIAVLRPSNLLTGQDTPIPEKTELPSPTQQLPTLDPILLMTAEAYRALPTPDFDLLLAQNQVKLRNHRIIYLIAKDATLDDFIVSAERLQTDIGVLVANDWETFLELETAEPSEIVIIHESALAFIDTEWTQHAYRHSKFLMFVNLYFPELNDILGTKEYILRPETWYPGNYWVFFLLMPGGSGYANENLDIPYGYYSFNAALMSGLENLGLE